MREICLRCLRPRTQCYCHQIKPVRAEPFFVILQHPRERRNPIGTARMAHLSLPDSRFVEGADFSEHQGVNDWLVDPGFQPVILFPGPSSFDLSTETREARLKRFPPERRLLIFVIDGTWSGALQILKKSRNLAQIPQIHFAFAGRSEYQIRKQPEDHCVSTVEAIHRILQVLDPASKPERLLAPFRWMVSEQVRLKTVNQKITSFRKRPS